MHPEEGSTATMTARAYDPGQSTRPQMAIPGQLESVAMQAKSLHETFNELRDRLSPILGPENPDADDLKAVQLEVSPVAGQLIDVHGVLYSLERRLRGLLDRIEL